MSERIERDSSTAHLTLRAGHAKQPILPHQWMPEPPVSIEVPGDLPHDYCGACLGLLPELFLSQEHRINRSYRLGVPAGAARREARASRYADKAKTHTSPVSRSPQRSMSDTSGTQ